MYAANYSTVYAIMLAGLILWSLLDVIIKRADKTWVRFAWKAVNFVGTGIALYGILAYTVLGRTASESHVFIMAAEYGSEFYREMLMNAFLYYPLGLTLSVLIGPWSVFAAFVLSATIELWQYCAGTGIAQGTDVMMNTLGTALGCLSWFIAIHSAIEKAMKYLKTRTNPWNGKN